MGPRVQCCKPQGGPSSSKAYSLLNPEPDLGLPLSSPLRCAWKSHIQGIICRDPAGWLMHSMTSWGLRQGQRGTQMTM